MENNCPDVLERIKKILTSLGWSRYKLALHCGIPYSSINNMFKRHTLPSLHTLFKLCDGLNITISDFFSENSLNIIPINDEIRHLIEMYNRLSPHKRSLLFSYLKGLYDSECSS